MPSKRRICDRCRRVVVGTCLDCRPPKREDRPSAASRGYGRRWQKARVGFLSRHPFCAECGRRSKKTLATVVDHVIPHRGDPKLFWDHDNWQPLCTRCHGQKTAGGA